MILFCKSYDDILLIICTCAQPSLCEAAALLVDELLDPAREVAAQAIDVEAGPCEPLDSDPGLRSFRGGISAIGVLGGTGLRPRTPKF